MKSPKGFTLIEMLVVVGVVSFILPAVFAIIFTILRQQAKIYALQEVKRQGDFVLNTIRMNLKNNATTIHTAFPPTDSNQVCNSTGSSGSGTLYFQDRVNNYFSYVVINDSNGIPLIASNSSIPASNPYPATTTNLTNDKTKTTSFSISCIRNASFSPPVIGISYQLQYNTTSTRPEDIASFTYQTKIQLRSY